MVGAIVDALRTALRPDQSEAADLAEIRALRESGSPEAIAALVTIASRHPNLLLRSEAAYAVASMLSDMDLEAWVGRLLATPHEDRPALALVLLELLAMEELQPRSCALSPETLAKALREIPDIVRAVAARCRDGAAWIATIQEEP